MDPIRILIEMAIDGNIIKKSGTWFTFDEKMAIADKFHGKDNMLSFLKQNENLIPILEQDVRTKYDL